MERSFAESITGVTGIAGANMSNCLLSGENPNRVMMFLEALRSLMIRAGLIALSFAVAGFFLAGSVIQYLHRTTGITLVAFSLPEAFLAYLTLALSIGVICSLPYILYETFSVLARIYLFVSIREMLVFWLASVLLFYAGAFFSFLVTLPYGIEFLLSYETETLQALISVKKFVSFCVIFVFGFGLIFELPLVMILLGWIGLVDAGLLGRYRRYAVLAISIVSAVLTPTPDLFNMMLMAVPLYLLFEIGLIGMRVFKKKQTTDVAVSPAQLGETNFI
ncbi:MAG: twin-arginine translocase subunit TatC [Desulfobacterales bacterium]|nr:twin-arginine translocase subunit TatC [Desulfobacterales bacterium]